MIMNAFLVVILLVSFKRCSTFRFATPMWRRSFHVKCNADEALVTFQTLAKANIELANKYFKDTFKTKDELLKKTEIIVEDKTNEINRWRQSYLQSKGLMTVCGVFEFFVTSCYLEITEEPINLANGHLPIKKALSVIENSAEPLLGTNCKLLKEFAKECGIESLCDLYSKLSSKIHNDPWDGDSVQIAKWMLEEPEYCFITKVATSLSLKIKADDSVPTP